MLKRCLVMVQDNKISVSDSVIQGSITNIGTNIQATERVTCKTCLASGNITIFVCNEVSCNNTFCEHCKNDDFPKKCQSCIDKITSQRIEELKLEQLKLAEAEEIRLQEELELRQVMEFQANLEIELQNQRFHSKPAKLMRSKIFILPLLQIFSILILLNGAVKIPDGIFYFIFNLSGILILNLMLTVTISFLAVFSDDANKNYLSLAESGNAPQRAMIFVFSPLISMVLFLIFALFIPIKLLGLLSFSLTILLFLFLRFVINNAVGKS